MKHDFCGWATRNDLRCSDGRTIRKDAFKDDDGRDVPLVWNHNHSDAFNVLGHARLENRDEGVYAYCYLNDTDQGRNMRELLRHGDVKALSIYANQLKQRGADVLHGAIRELSVVLAGANPGAYIDSLSLAHGEDVDDGEAVIYTGEAVEVCHSGDGAPDEALSHSDGKEKEDEMDEKEKKEPDPEKKQPDKKESKADGKSVGEVLDEMTDEHRAIVEAMIGKVVRDMLEEDDDSDDGEEEEKEMKHNVFEQDNAGQTMTVLSHADQESIMAMAKDNRVGTLRNALNNFMEDSGALQHDAVSGGFATEDVEALFPEFKDVRPGAPELVTNDQGWVGTVMNKVHKSPISRIRTAQVDIRSVEDATANALRGRGFKKGKQKSLAGNLPLLRRTTEPQTVYVKNALFRDDILDMTDFDYVRYLFDVDRAMLNEELARAIMVGDGRLESDADKIFPDKIRPIWLDDELYTIHKDIDYDRAKVELQGSNTGGYFGENYIYAEAMVSALLYARERFRGSGTPDMFVTPHMLNVMLLARDMNGRRIYSSKSELAATLNVGEIYTAEQFDGRTRTTDDGKTKRLLAIVVNLADYHLGATKGGEVTHFTQFDIDFNQEKSLLETRVSGALTRVSSAIAIEQDVTPSSGGGDDEDGGE